PPPPVTGSGVTPPPAPTVVPAAPALPAGGSTQTVDGVTVRLVLQVADLNRIAFAYQALGPDGLPIENVSVVSGERNPAPRLTDDTGTSYPWLDPAPEITGGLGPDAGLVVFDSTSLQAAPAQLALHLKLPLAVPYGSATPGVAPAKRLLTYNFDLSVPVDPVRRLAELHQAVTVGGIPLMLDRVIVTRSEARVVLSLAPGATVDMLKLEEAYLSAIVPAQEPPASQG